MKLADHWTQITCFVNNHISQSPFNLIIFFLIEIEFNAGERVKYIRFNILNDSIPELIETFKVNITQVSLVTTRKMNYGMMNGLQVDVPPKIGQHAMVEVSINENDDPYGTIEFTQVARLVHERDGRVLIAVNRTGLFSLSYVDSPLFDICI